MSFTSTVPRGRVEDAWQHAPARAREIAAALHAPDPVRWMPFDPAHLDALPEPACRWLTHAITPDTVPAAAVELCMRGEILFGDWRHFTATQLLVPDAGFVWSAHTRLFGLPITGFDAYAHGQGLMRWRLAGLLPVQSGSGADIALSAVDRLAAESVLVPGSLLSASWRRGPEPDSATYTRAFGDGRWRSRATVHVAADGRLTSLSMHRWGRPQGKPFGLYPFEVLFDGEFAADGLRIGDGIRAAWLDAHGTRSEFYRATIDAAHFFGTASTP